MRHLSAPNCQCLPGIEHTRALNGQCAWLPPLCGLQLDPHVCDGPSRAGAPIPLSDMTLNTSVMAFWAAGNNTELHAALSVMQDVIAQNKLPRQNPVRGQTASQV